MMDIEDQKSVTRNTDNAPIKDSAVVCVPVNKPVNKTSQNRLPFVGIIVCAGVLFIALFSSPDAFQNAKSDHWWYGTCVPSVSILLCSLYLFSFEKEKDTLNLSRNFFLLVWNLVGACMLTSPTGLFVTTSNGYYALWGMVLFSVKAFTDSLHREKLTAAYLSALHGFGICAVVLLTAIIPYVKRGNTEGRVLYIFIMSIFTLSFVISLSTMDFSGETLSNQLRARLLAVFSIAWIIVACFTTFKYPFLDSGNGFFAAWGGVITSVYALSEALAL